MQNLFILTKQCVHFYGKVYPHILRYILLPLFGVLVVLFYANQALAVTIPQEVWVQTSDGYYYFNSTGCARNGFNLPNINYSGGWVDCKDILPPFISFDSVDSAQDTIRQDEVLKTMTVLMGVSFVCFITYFFWQALAF